MVHQEMFTLFSKREHGQKKSTERDADDNKRSSMTMSFLPLNAPPISLHTIATEPSRRTKPNLRLMRASRGPLFVNQVYVPTGQIHLRQISKIKQYDAIDKKYVRRWVWFTRKCSLCSQNENMGKKKARKEMPMTINDRR